MSTDTVTLAQLDAFMAVRGRRTLAFPLPIEEQFERDTSPRRCQRLTTGILVSVIVYNLFLVADWLLVPDVLLACRGDPSGPRHPVDAGGGLDDIPTAEREPGANTSPPACRSPCSCRSTTASR